MNPFHLTNLERQINCAIHLLYTSLLLCNGFEWHIVKYLTSDLMFQYTREPLGERVNKEKSSQLSNLEAVMNAGKLSWNTTRSIPQNMQRLSRLLIGCILQGMV